MGEDDSGIVGVLKEPGLEAEAAKRWIFVSRRVTGLWIEEPGEGRRNAWSIIIVITTVDTAALVEGRWERPRPLRKPTVDTLYGVYQGVQVLHRHGASRSQQSESR